MSEEDCREHVHEYVSAREDEVLEDGLWRTRFARKVHEGREATMEALTHVREAQHEMAETAQALRRAHEAHQKEISQRMGHLERLLEQLASQGQRPGSGGGGGGGGGAAEEASWRAVHEPPRRVTVDVGESSWREVQQPSLKVMTQPRFSIYRRGSSGSSHTRSSLETELPHAGRARFARWSMLQPLQSTPAMALQQQRSRASLMMQVRASQVFTPGDGGNSSDSDDSDWGGRESRIGTRRQQSLIDVGDVDYRV
jgi:hypothetical protein